MKHKQTIQNNQKGGVEMKRVKVILEFDENDLGEQWMNPDNLALLLYTDRATKEDLLKIVSYEEDK